MKYVILMQQVGGKGGLTQLFPVVFPEQLSHYEVAKQLLNGKPATPVAAGFVYTKSTRGVPFQVLVERSKPSTSLRMGPGPFDQDIIEDVLFMNGNVINMPSLWTEHPHYQEAFIRFSWNLLDKALKEDQPNLRVEALRQPRP